MKQAITLNQMFGCCFSLQSLNLENWDVSNVVNMYGTFDHCFELKHLNLKNWNNWKCQSTSSMFEGVSELQSLIFTQKKWNYLMFDDTTFLDSNAREFFFNFNK